MAVDVMNNIGVDLDEVSATERQQILVVDDDIDTIMLVKQVLLTAGFNVMSATSGPEALRKTVERQPDLILLDLMMPDMDGWEVYQRLKPVTDSPVVILSAKTSKDDVVAGLKLGIDEYITKPFHNLELIERLRTVLRRVRSPKPSTRMIFPGTGLVVDIANQQVAINGKNIALTQKEFAILALMASHAPSVVPYDMIAKTIWRTDSTEIRNRIKYLVYLLRRKFAEALPGKRIIVNFDRRGYKLLTEQG